MIKILSNLLKIPITNKFFDKNTDKQIENLFEIPQSILKDIQIEYKFGIENGISDIAR